MTPMGMTERPVKVAMSFRSGALRHLGVMLGGGGGMAIALGAYDLLHSHPKQGFDLLQAWGPAFLIAMLAIFTAGQFLGGVNDSLRDSFVLLSESVREGAQSSSRTADALTRLADQGGRQAEEVRRLAIYAGREFPALYERFDAQDKVLSEVAASLKGVHARLDSIEDQDKGRERTQ